MSREDVIQEIVECLARLHRPMDHTAWRSLGLSHAQAGMLFMLLHHQNASIKQMANSMDVSQSAVTQLIDPLIEKGLVSRVSDPSDRRVSRLGLTVKGRAVMKKLAKIKTARLRAALAELNSNELTVLLQLVSKMSPAIEPEGLDKK